jgi:hypothetical protein
MAKIPCKGKTRTGEECRAPAGASGLCFLHAHPEQAHTLGQIGGRKNRRSVVDLQVPDNMTAADLRKVAGQAIRLLLSGELRAREASALAQLCNALYRVLPTADLEARLANLEEQLSEQESPKSMDTDAARSRGQGEARGGTESQPDDVDTKESADGEEGGSDGSVEGGEA